jgi:hypothetical protein
MDINALRPADDPRGTKDVQLHEGQRVADGAARRQGDAQAPRAGGPLAAGRDERSGGAPDARTQTAAERAHVALARLLERRSIEYRAHLPGDVKFEVEVDPRTQEVRVVVRRRIDGRAMRELTLEEIERLANGETDVAGLFLDARL